MPVLLALLKEVLVAWMKKDPKPKADTPIDPPVPAEESVPVPHRTRPEFAVTVISKADDGSFVFDLARIGKFNTAQYIGSLVLRLFMVAFFGLLSWPFFRDGLNFTTNSYLGMLLFMAVLAFFDVIALWILLTGHIYFILNSIGTLKVIVGPSGIVIQRNWRFIRSRTLVSRSKIKAITPVGRDVVIEGLSWFTQEGLDSLVEGEAPWLANQLQLAFEKTAPPPPVVVPPKPLKREPGIEDIAKV